MISWKSVLKYLNCLKFTKDGKKLNFDDFVEKNTGIQTYVYKIRNILFKMDPTFGCQSIEGVVMFNTNNFSGAQRCFRYLGRYKQYGGRGSSFSFLRMGKRCPTQNMKWTMEQW
jgi:hypothetical protein